MERSVEEFRLDGPIGPAPQDAAVGEAQSDGPVLLSQQFRHEDIQGICANPLREEPSTMAIATVKRLGVVGLVACAVGSGLLRWWRSLHG